MKTLVSLLMLTFFGLVAFATPVNEGDYLVTKDGKFFCAKIHRGVFSLKAESNDGIIRKVKYADVLSYKKNGDVYEKKPFYLNNKETGNEVFMKLVCRKNGYRLYKFDDNLSGIRTHTRYYVFKDDNTYWLEVCCKNCKTINQFFNE